MTLRQEKLNTLFAKLLARFLQSTASDSSIVTVTHFDIATDMHSAHSYLSVFPEKNEAAVLAAIEKNRDELAEFLRKNTSMKFLPRIYFEIDKGEKNRQRIDELLRKK